jgi:ABC-2 type transport system ATP-binding protein
MELKVDRLTKQYKNKIAVDRLSFSLKSGVTGLLGENGAGKTTLIRMICGVLAPTSGEITYDDIPVTEEAYRDILGYLPQNFGYYPEFSGYDFLMYFSALKGLNKKSAKIRSEELLDLVGLSGVAKKRISTYSGGMRQRLGIAQALINRPEVLVLDEPTAGLDPKERVRFRNLIKEVGMTSIVLFSTHIVSDVEHIADHVMLMKAGQIIWKGQWNEADGSMEDFYLRKFDVNQDVQCESGSST